MDIEPLNVPADDKNLGSVLSAAAVFEDADNVRIEDLRNKRRETAYKLESDPEFRKEYEAAERKKKADELIACLYPKADNVQQDDYSVVSDNTDSPEMLDDEDLSSNFTTASPPTKKMAQSPTDNFDFSKILGGLHIKSVNNLTINVYLSGGSK
jgi:hypothetical protein